MEIGEFSKVTQNALKWVIKIEREDGSIGSGLITEDGIIITCEHVIRGAKALQIKLRDGPKITAEVIAADPRFDLAALRPKFPTGSELISNLPKGAHLVQVALTEGQDLVAIGHPLNLEWSVTGGHYNAKRQEGEISQLGINLKTPLLQVDVVINQGNSGGPLVDMSGHVVGLATAIIDPAKANNIGFVIPVDTVMRFREALGPDVSTTPALVPFSCGHYHAPVTKWCDITGKSIHPVGEMPQEKVQGEMPYSCGHSHPPGLNFCPITGKPVRPVDSSIPGAADKTSRALIRYNCGHDHPNGLSWCPETGRPIKPILT
jgi:hypothetical protein